MTKYFQYFNMWRATKKIKWFENQPLKVQLSFEAHKLATNEKVLSRSNKYSPLFNY